MKKAIITAAIACVMVVPATFAQTNAQSNNSQTPATPNARHEHHMSVAQRVEFRVRHLTHMLGLSTSQQQQATTIFTNAENSNAPVMADMRTARKNLHNAVATNDSANAIKQYAASIGNDTSTLVATNATASEQFFQILTPEQQSKMQQMEGRRFHGAQRGRAL
jgi:Spy/CpxP family protein refolding chaperone